MSEPSGGYLPLPDLLASMRHDSSEGVWRVEVPPDWMQGRTLYGGISAALALHAVKAEHDETELPPLRSGQISFIGPASGHITIRTDMLRQGKSSRFIAADVMDDGTITCRAVFCFGNARASALDQTRLPMPTLPPPEECPNFFHEALSPAFSRHFDARIAMGSRPVTGAAEADVALWLRCKDAGVADFDTLLLALADAPPPAAMAMYTAPAMISTMTWMLTRLSTPAAGSDGWLLCRATSQQARDGYSAQVMQMWSPDGVAVLSGLQSVALFG
jgi:acyl-CoA thioesterase